MARTCRELLRLRVGGVSLSDRRMRCDWRWVLARESDSDPGTELSPCSASPASMVCAVGGRKAICDMRRALMRRRRM